MLKRWLLKYCSWSLRKNSDWATECNIVGEGNDGYLYSIQVGTYIQYTRLDNKDATFADCFMVNMEIISIFYIYLNAQK